MAGAGYKLFNTGDVLTAAQVNTYLQEQTVMVFASSTARTTALSGVLAEGMMSYLQDTNSVEFYNGTSWVALASGDLTEIVAGTGITVTSGTGPIPTVALTTPVSVANGGTGISSFGTGIATFLETPSSANLAAALTDETGTGAAVFASSPTLVTPDLGTPSAATLTNATGLPITAGTTGTLGETRGGTAQTTFTTGDLLYASGTNTLAKRAIGSTGDVLTVSGGVPTWAAPAGGGGMTLLSTTSLTGASTTISSISGSYKNLYGVIYNVTTAADGAFRIAPNNVTNLCTYSGTRRITAADLIGANDDYLGTNGSCESTVAAYFEFLIEDYANTSNFKPVEFKSVQARSDTGAIQTEFVGGYFRSLSAVTSLVFSSAGGNLSTGTVLLYGVS